MANFSPSQISRPLAEKYNESLSKAHAVPMDKAATNAIENAVSKGSAITIIIVVSGFFAAFAAYRGFLYWQWAI